MSARPNSKACKICGSRVATHGDLCDYCWRRGRDLIDTYILAFAEGR